MKRRHTPQCFISYSWEEKSHNQWVRMLAEKLMGGGVRTSLDQWDLAFGDDLLEYMETSIRKADFVLLICTPVFARKANAKKGGVGYETAIVTGEIFHKVSRSGKFVPLLRLGDPKRSLPSYLMSRKCADFRADENFDQSLEELFRLFFDSPKDPKPKLGTPPPFVRTTEPLQATSVLERQAIEAANRLIHATITPDRQNRSVYVNCPLDNNYAPLLHAIVFTIIASGLIPRSILEISEAPQPRIVKVFALIAACEYGIHDIGKARLNQAVQLGIFLESQRSESGRKKRKEVLILDEAPYRFQADLSDLAGYDIVSHSNDPKKVARIVRDWLSLTSRKQIPTSNRIWTSYSEFQTEFPKLFKGMLPADVTFADFRALCSQWLQSNFAQNLTRH